MPSYLSSTQTVGPRRRRISAASSAGEASIGLSGWNTWGAASASRSSRARIAVAPMSPTSWLARLTSARGRSKAWATADSRSPSRSPIRSSPPRILTTYWAVSGSQRRRSSSKRAALAAGPLAAWISANARATSARDGEAAGSGWTARLGEDVGDGQAEIAVAVVGRAERGLIGRGDPGDGARHGPPAEACRPAVRLREGASRPEHGSHGQLVGRQAAELVGEETGLLGGPGGGRDALRDLAPAAHGPDGIPSPRCHSDRGSRRRWPVRRSSSVGTCRGTSPRSVAGTATRRSPA